MFYGIELNGFVGISPYESDRMILLDNDWILPFYRGETFFPSLMRKRYNLFKHTLRNSANRSLAIRSWAH